MSKLLAGRAPARRARELLGAALLAAALATPAPAHAAAWLPPLGLSAAGQNAAAPDVAQAADGTTIAVWERFDGANWVVQSRVRPPGGPFGAEETLAEAGKDARGPRVAMNAQGEVVLVWTLASAASVENVVMVAFRPPGGSFGPPQAVSQPPEIANEADVAIDDAGNVGVLWSSGDPQLTAYLRAARGPFPGPVVPLATEIDKETAAVTGGTFSSTRFEPVELAADAQGTFRAAWLRDRESVLPSFINQRVVRTTLLPPGAAVEPIEGLESSSRIAPGGAGQAAGDLLVDLDLAVNPAGDAIVAWSRQEGPDPGIEAAFSKAGVGTPGDRFPVGHEQVSSLAAAGQPESPAAELDAQGAATVVWAQGPPGQPRVESAVRPAGPGFGAPVSLSKPGVPSDQPDLAVGAGGRAVAVWRESTAPGSIQGAVRPAGGAFGAPDTIAADGSPGSPAVSLDPAGNAAAVWRRSDGANDVVELSAFDATPPVLGGVAIPAAGRPGEQLAFSASASDDWSPVAIDWSFGDGASAGGASVGHAYGSSGVFTPVVTATDGAGNSATASGRTAIDAPPAGGEQLDPGVGGAASPLDSGVDGAASPLDRVRPRVTDFDMRKRSFAVGREPTAVSAGAPPLGSAFRYSLSEDARVTIRIDRELAGLRDGRRCRKATARLRRTLTRRVGERRLRSLRCVALERLGALVRPGHQGANSTAFSGRIGDTRLRLGHHRASIVARDGAGNVSTEQRLRFRIVPRRP